MAKLNGGNVLIDLTSMSIDLTDQTQITNTTALKNLLDLYPILKNQSLKNLIFIKVNDADSGYPHLIPCIYYIDGSRIYICGNYTIDAGVYTFYLIVRFSVGDYDEISIQSAYYSFRFFAINVADWDYGTIGNIAGTDSDGLPVVEAVNDVINGYLLGLSEDDGNRVVGINSDDEPIVILKADLLSGCIKTPSTQKYLVVVEFLDIVNGGGIAYTIQPFSFVSDINVTMDNLVTILLARSDISVCGKDNANNILLGSFTSYDLDEIDGCLIKVINLSTNVVTELAL